MNIPIPKVCFDCRYSNRVTRRNPRELIKRNCDKCSEELLSSYSSDNPALIYCENCYDEYSS